MNYLKSFCLGGLKINVQFNSPLSENPMYRQAHYVFQEIRRVETFPTIREKTQF